MFPVSYHQNGGFSMAMLVYQSVTCVTWKGIEAGRKVPTGQVGLCGSAMIRNSFCHGAAR